MMTGVPHHCRHLGLIRRHTCFVQFGKTDLFILITVRISMLSIKYYKKELNVNNKCIKFFVSLCKDFWPSCCNNVVYFSLLYLFICSICLYHLCIPLNFHDLLLFHGHIHHLLQSMVCIVYIYFLASILAVVFRLPLLKNWPSAFRRNINYQ